MLGLILPVASAVAAAPVITSANTVDVTYYPDERFGNIFQYQITATNSPTSFDATGLPALSRIDRTSGMILGESSQPGIYNATITAANADGTTTAPLQIRIHPAAIGVAGTPGTYYAGDTLRFTVTFNAPVTVTGSPALMIGVAAPYVSGSGTSTLTFAYTVTPTDGPTSEIYVQGLAVNGGTIRSADGLDFAGGPPLRYHSTMMSIAPAPQVQSETRSVSAGSPFSYQIVTNFATTSPTFTANPLPAGLSLDSATGVISGTPTSAGNHTIALGATGSGGRPRANGTLALSVSSVSTPPTGTPVAVTSGSTSGTVNQIFNYTVAATGGANAFSAAGLPPGLSISNAGVISGTPTTSGSYSVIVDASNSSGARASGTIAITIASAPSTPPPSTPPPALAQTITLAPAGPITVGQAVTLNASASSGLPVTLSLVRGNAVLNGNQLTVNDTSGVVIRGTQSGGAGFAAASTEITVSASRTTQAVEFVSPVSSIIIGQPVQLSATSSSGLPVTYSIVSGSATLNGSALTVTGAGPVVVRASQAGNAQFDAASTDVTITGAVRAAQSVTLANTTNDLVSDGSLTLAGTSTSGLPVTFEIVSGPATLSGSTLVPTAASGVVTVRVRQAGSDVFAPAEHTRTLTIVPAGRLINLSSRVTVREGDASRSFIAGFVVSGTAPKRMLVRAAGPALAEFGVQATLANPRLRIFDQAGRQVAENDDWSGAETAAAFARLGAFGFGSESRDAAMLVTLPPGPYSLHVDANGGQGVALAEIYDASDAPALETQQLINLSTRAFVESGEGVLAAGFVVTGSVPKRVLVRGIGPALTAFNVTGALADPVLRVYRGTTVIAQNDDWHVPQPDGAGQPAATQAEISAAAVATGAFALTAGSKDAAVILTLAPGAYTAIVSGAGETTGAGLVELYEIPAGR